MDVSIEDVDGKIVLKFKKLLVEEVYNESYTKAKAVMVNKKLRLFWYS